MTPSDVLARVTGLADHRVTNDGESPRLKLGADPGTGR
jgi:hypothetical protein